MGERRGRELRAPREKVKKFNVEAVRKQMEEMVSDAP